MAGIANPLKRPSPSDATDTMDADYDQAVPVVKRRRTDSASASPDLLAMAMDLSYPEMSEDARQHPREVKVEAKRQSQFREWTLSSKHDESRNGLRRAIALVLHHVGFDGATDEAFEGFASRVEEYLLAFTGSIIRTANASRRAYPIPLDFESTMRRFNLSTSLLRPHALPARRTPLRPKSLLVPEAVTPAHLLLDSSIGELPLLGDELSGHDEKVAREYVPRAFPDFPSRHTWRYTPTEVIPLSAAASAGLKEPAAGAGASVAGDGRPTANGGGSAASAAAAGATTAFTNHRLRDAKTKREMAAREAKHGEEALRRLVRAAKIRSQMEVRAAISAVGAGPGLGGGGKNDDSGLSLWAQTSGARRNGTLADKAKAAKGGWSKDKLAANKARESEGQKERESDRERAKERYDAWEAAMRDLMQAAPQGGDAGSGTAKDKGKGVIGGSGVTGASALVAGSGGRPDTGGARFEIADHSMVVNSERAYKRTELPRAGLRSS